MKRLLKEEVCYNNGKELPKELQSVMTNKNKNNFNFHSQLFVGSGFTGVNEIFYDVTKTRLFGAENYVDGKKSGKCEYFHENGNRWFTINFRDGIKDGIYQKYDNNKTNDLLEEDMYKNNEKTSLASGKKLEEGLNQLNYANGKLYMEFTLLNGKYNGEFKTWYETGELSSISHYKNGVKEGTFYEYFEDGEVKKEVTYKNGLKHGCEKIYHYIED